MAPVHRVAEMNTTEHLTHVVSCIERWILNQGNPQSALLFILQDIYCAFHFID